MSMELILCLAVGVAVFLLVLVCLLMSRLAWLNGKHLADLQAAKANAHETAKRDLIQAWEFEIRQDGKVVSLGKQTYIVMTLASYDVLMSNLKTLEAERRNRPIISK